jgi:hypothetical protein
MTLVCNVSFGSPKMKQSFSLCRYIRQNTPMYIKNRHCKWCVRRIGSCVCVYISVDESADECSGSLGCSLRCNFCWYLSGADVIISIFFEFRQFSAKNGVFLKNQRHYHFLHNLALFCVKTPIFSPFFGKNIFKIITSFPGKSTIW